MNKNRFLMGKKGATTIHFALVFMCFMLLFVGVCKVLLKIHAENEAMRQASTASQMLLSYYEDHLRADYGLLAYQNDEARVKNLLTSIKAQKTNYKVVESMDSLKVFQMQAILLGKIEFAKDLESFVNSKTFDAKQLEEAYDKKNHQEEQKKELDQSLKKQTESEDDSNAEADKQKAKKVMKMIKNYQGKPMAENESSTGRISSEMWKNKYLFRKDTAMSLSALERMEMAHYLLAHFNHRLSKTIERGDKTGQTQEILRRKGVYEGGEIEFILTESHSEKQAQFQVAQRIFLLREPLNLLHLVTSKTKMEEISLLAATTTALFPISAPLVEAGIIGVWTSIESYADVKRLLEGKAIPWVKTSESDWYTSIENQLEETSPDNESRKEKKSLGDVEYQDCLFVLLLAQGDDVTAFRTMSLVDLNLKTSYNTTLDWRQMVTRHEISYCLIKDQWQFLDQGYLLQEKVKDEKK